MIQITRSAGKRTRWAAKEFVTDKIRKSHTDKAMMVQNSTASLRYLMLRLKQLFSRGTFPIFKRKNKNFEEAYTPELIWREQSVNTHWNWWYEFYAQMEYHFSNNHHKRTNVRVRYKKNKENNQSKIANNVKKWFFHDAFDCFRNRTFRSSALGYCDSNQLNCRKNR